MGIWLRAGHDHSADVVACLCAARAPLHFGSWSFPAARSRRRSAPVRFMRRTRPLRHQLEGSPAMGITYLAASSTSKGGSSSAFTFIILAVLVGLFYVLIMRPQRNRQRRAMQTQSQVMPGQRVRTTAGMYGTVISGDDRDVVIEIAPGVQVTMLRRAIMDVISDDSMPAHEDIGDGEAEEPEQETSSEHDDTTPGDDWDIKKDHN